MSSGLLNVILLVPVFLFSLCFHEFAHAWMAVKRGDPTPQLLGRLSMHPMAHADILGTLILPTLAIYTGAPFFGWAKPVPVDIRNLKYGRRDFALIAAAGPLANLILAALTTVFLYFLVRVPMQNSITETLQTFSLVSIQVNLMLAFFNLLPLAPLDGFNVIQGCVPQRVAIMLSKTSQFSGIILIVLLLTGSFKYLSIPVQLTFRFLLNLIG
ncbi:MAG: site-2 protease family protein [Proteobacteria bacterium]|nr:site-2 protease family protein [Pseudomonadota bacterium]NBY18919.1 site-2 protease family protein [bacterium]